VDTVAGTWHRRSRSASVGIRAAGHRRYAAKISARTKLFAIGASSNALGTVNDIKLARRLTREVNALLVVDAVHYAPHFSLDVRDLGMDFLLCSAYKFYGPHVACCIRVPAHSMRCRPIDWWYRIRMRRIASKPVL